ncbi:uncharacterized protein LOC116136437 [Pistacia vera]|uniref:uncharacterized protein LOC116136437 n=1 Tax=Pistacia vera TaxID=55513 RepID=UPI0012630607|nr:uncharacterized protein LOC116136437 [Pistacia vera]
MNSVVHGEFHGGIANVAALSVDNENKKTESVSLPMQQNPTQSPNPFNVPNFSSTFFGPNQNKANYPLPQNQIYNQQFHGGNFGNRGRSRGGGRGKFIYQVCGKTGHLALNCYHRFDVNFTGHNTSIRSNFHSPSFTRQPSFNSEIGSSGIGNSRTGSSYYPVGNHGVHHYVNNHHSRTSGMSQTPRSTVGHVDGQPNSVATHTTTHLHNQALMAQTQLHNSHLVAINYIATPSIVHDDAWYMDSGATDHVTSDFSQLTGSTSYAGSEQLQVGNGELLFISDIGSADLNCPFRTLHLRNVLCVPHITKNFLSVSKLTKDNLVNVEFFIDSCVVKDKFSKVIILKGMLKDGLYQRQAPGHSLPTSAEELEHSVQLQHKSSPVFSTNKSRNKSCSTSFPAKMLPTPLMSEHAFNSCKSACVDFVNQNCMQYTGPLVSNTVICTDDAPIINNTNSLQSFPVQSNNVMLWHNRLGHPNSTILARSNLYLSKCTDFPFKTSNFSGSNPASNSINTEYVSSSSIPSVWHIPDSVFRMSSNPVSAPLLSTCPSTLGQSTSQDIPSSSSPLLSPSHSPKSHLPQSSTTSQSSPTTVLSLPSTSPNSTSFTSSILSPITIGLDESYDIVPLTIELNLLKPPPPTLNTHPMITRSKTRAHNTCLVSPISLATKEPATVIEALSHPTWKAAMQSEFDVLMSKKTWELVPATTANGYFE